MRSAKIVYASAFFTACLLPALPHCIPVRLGSAFQINPNVAEWPIRVDVNLVSVDAIVYDSQHRHVRNLNHEDFEILEDGVPREVRNFSYEEQLRTFVFLIDNCDSAALLSVPEAIARSLKRFVEERLKPGERMAIIPCSEGSGTLHNLTSDRSVLQKAGRTIARLDNIWHPDSSFWLCGIGSCYGTAARLQPPFYTVSSFETLRFAVEAMARLQGRKVLVTISSFDDWSKVDRDGSRLRALTERANRAGIVHYVLDPGEAVPGSMGGLATGPISLVRSARKRALDAIATGSGGFALHCCATPGYRYPSGTQSEGPSDFSRKLNQPVIDFLEYGMSRIDADTAGYYLLSYNLGPPEAQTKRYHRIQVRVRKPGLTVRAREGYFAAAPAQPEVMKESSAEDRLRIATSGSIDDGDMPFRMAVFSYAGEPDQKTRERRPVARVMVAIDPKDLAVQAAPNGNRVATVTLRAAAFRGDLDPAATASATCSAKAPTNGLERRRMLCSAELKLPQAGPYVVRAAVMDAFSARLGTAWLASKMLDYSPDDTGVSQMTLLGIPQTPDEDPFAGFMPRDDNPVDHVFSPGQTVIVSFDAYPPLRPKPPQLIAEFTLERYTLDAPPQFLHGRRFQTVYKFETLPIPVVAGATSVRATGKLTLPYELPQGEYHLKAAVYDAKDKSRKGPGRPRFSEDITTQEQNYRVYDVQLLTDAYISVVSRDSAAPARVHDPMGFVRLLKIRE